MTDRLCRAAAHLSKVFRRDVGRPGPTRGAARRARRRATAITGCYTNPHTNRPFYRAQADTSQHRAASDRVDYPWSRAESGKRQIDNASKGLLNTGPSILLAVGSDGGTIVTGLGGARDERRAVAT